MSSEPTNAAKPSHTGATPPRSPHWPKVEDDSAAYRPSYVTFVCPRCGCEDDRLSDGICPDCFYVLTGGDQGTEVPSWQAWLGHGKATA